MFIKHKKILAINLTVAIIAIIAGFFVISGPSGAGEDSVIEGLGKKIKFEIVSFFHMNWI